ncbi:Gfo/Idh/MocA family oxidoreductase [Paenibacillus sediminis]|uniref:Dehydrogenase n=1 Tax=Paenibacillus sediminis TaxID=664909 RepID=A0ABS4H5Q0_9BACL|nr:Gfo/Idh/MocA family oxidoreductase [Paenibacillus sediminis]MBP1937865.1 putative dehydrogenase [Paenibacillus sediminis]
MRKVKVGIIGCGNISAIYFQNIKSYPVLELAACADIDLSRAQARAAEFNVDKAYTVEELLADPEIEIVINLTIPKAHAEISLKALEAGKHVYVEKPLAVTREDGLAVLQLAQAKGLRVAGAPETFMGGGIQTCLNLIEEGVIGTPIAASGFMLSGGPEGWHPDPAFFYQVGGGPMFDMGPYYITALVTLLGPIRKVSGMTKISYPERLITSEPKAGTRVPVEIPTHIAGLLQFESGVIGTLVTSFDTKAGSDLPNIEIYGSEGTLRVPDPNNFGGEVLLRKAGEWEWKSIPLTRGFTNNNRGIGVADLAWAIQKDRNHRANGETAYHVLEAMHGLHDAANADAAYVMKSTCSRSLPMPEREESFHLGE